MFHSRKSLLYNNGTPWVKKEGTGFDVIMGAYDGAEICELISIFILSLLETKYDSKSIGLYKDDGLSIFRNVSGPELEKMKKHIQKIFKEKMLDVIIECNTKIVNHLDVTFNLNDGTYKPYKKPNDETKYIHVDSDHPPSIIKQIPKSIATRLSSLSSSKETFLESAQSYEQNLASCGYKEKLTYVEQSARKPKGNEKRKRNIIWFNSPYSKTVKANIDKYFFRLINKPLKLSYSCMPNLKSLINSHNQNILRDQPQSTPKNLQLFTERELSNEWFLSYKKSVVLRYNHLRQRKLYQAI